MICDIYKNIEEYNPNKKWIILIVINDIIADVLSNIKLNPVVTELLIRGRKLMISLVFITLSYFAVPKKYWSECNALFHYENVKQTRASINRI